MSRIDVAQHFISSGGGYRRYALILPSQYRWEASTEQEHNTKLHKRPLINCSRTLWRLRTKNPYDPGASPGSFVYLKRWSFYVILILSPPYPSFLFLFIVWRQMISHPKPFWSVAILPIHSVTSIHKSLIFSLSLPYFFSFFIYYIASRSYTSLPISFPVQYIAEL